MQLDIRVVTPRGKVVPGLSMQSRGGMGLQQLRCFPRLVFARAGVVEGVVTTVRGAVTFSVRGESLNPQEVDELRRVIQDALALV